MHERLGRLWKQQVYASAGRLDAALEIVKRMEPEFKVRPRARERA